MADQKWQPGRCGLFRVMDAEQIHRIESASSTHRLRRGDVVYGPGDASNCVYVIVSGRVKVCQPAHDGKLSIIAIIEQGDVFGEMALVESENRQEHAEAVENTVLLQIPVPELQRVMTMNPHSILELARLVAARRRRTERRLRNLLFHSNRERLIHLLMELLEFYGRKTETGYDLDIKLSHQEMANIIGSTRETVTVVLGELQREGLVQIARRRVHILDAESLAKQVNSEVELPGVNGNPASGPAPTNYSPVAH